MNIHLLRERLADLRTGEVHLLTSAEFHDIFPEASEAVGKQSCVEVGEASSCAVWFHATDSVFASFRRKQPLLPRALRRSAF
jgi:hypothetical protein